LYISLIFRLNSSATVRIAALIVSLIGVMLIGLYSWSINSYREFIGCVSFYDLFNFCKLRFFKKKKMRIQIARKRKCGNLVFVMSVPPKNKRKKEKHNSKIYRKRSRSIPMRWVNNQVSVRLQTKKNKTGSLGYVVGIKQICQLHLFDLINKIYTFIIKQINNYGINWL